MRILEARRPRQDLDPVASELRADDVDLALDHPARAHRQVLDRDLLLDPVALPVDIALAQTGEVDDRFTQRLGRDRAGVHRDTADLLTLRDPDSLAELRRL